MVELQERERGLEARTNAGLYQLLADAYSVATYLRDRAEAWIEFCKDECWLLANRRPPSRHSKKAPLRAVLQKLFGFEGRGPKQASEWAKRLKPPFDDGVAASTIPSYLKAAAHENTAARKRRARPRTIRIERLGRFSGVIKADETTVLRFKRNAFSANLRITVSIAETGEPKELFRCAPIKRPTAAVKAP